MFINGVRRLVESAYLAGTTLTMPQLECLAATANKRRLRLELDDRWTPSSGDEEGCEDGGGLL